MTAMVGVVMAMTVLCLIASAGEGRAEGALVLENEHVRVLFGHASRRFEATDKASGRRFLADGRLHDGGGEVALADVRHPVFGEGQAIEVCHANGDRDRIMLFQGMRFVLFHSVLHNDDADAMFVNHVRRVSVGIDLGKAQDALRALGTAGLTAPDKHTGSYAYLAIADPETRNGVVAGWLTHDRGSGVVFSEVRDGAVRLDGQIDYGRVRIEPGADAQTEVFAVGYFDDARLGLEAYADEIARIYSITLRPQPSGYCTWYSERYGGASDEKHLAELTAFTAKHLKPFGFSFVQIDDKWQEGERRNGPAKNFTTHKPDGPYPRGMKPSADDIAGQGLTPGLWFMPFAGDHEDPFFKPHLNWFVKHEKGEPFEARWGGTSLDMTHPSAREHLRSIVGMIAHEWGYKYLKMDGLWTGTATRLTYVNDGYKDDQIGEAIFHDPSKTNIEAYRDGLRLVREAAGDDVFLLGCCASQNMRSFGGTFGLVDAMRIGPDNGAGWDALLRGPVHGSRKYFLHGRVWYNDPDPVYVRASMPLSHARLIASWVAISGQLCVNSDWLSGLPEDRLDILKRIMPSHGLLPRPVDLFENDLPRIWLLTDDRGDPRRDVIGLYNWHSGAADFYVPMDRIGLSANTRYVAFDYWGNCFVPPFEKQLRVTVPAQSCRILAVRAELDRPQLISASRHVTQGIVDVTEETWDAATRTLSGRSKIVAGDPYELRVVALSRDSVWQLDAADASADADVTFEQTNGLVRATIHPSASGEVKWRLRFGESARPLPQPEPVGDLEASAEPFEPVRLSWERRDGLAYEVERAGRQICIVHGAEWCDGDTEGGRSYDYGVTVIDWLGRRSAPSRTTVTTPKRPELPPLPPKPDVSLTTLKPLEARTGWGRIGVGKSAQGLPLRIGAETFADGIGLHANAKVVYARDPAYRRFVAIVGIDEAKRSNSRSSLVCKVVSAYGPQLQPLASSPVLKFGQIERWHFDLALPDDCQQIILIVDDAGDGINSDHADWVEAGFVTRDP